MDEQLSRLERDVRALGPEGQLPLARALARAGRADQAAAALRVAFACPLRFEALRPTGDLLVRHCERCERDVRWVESPDELVERALQGACVAFHPAKLTRPSRRPGVDPLRAPEHPCVVQSERRYRDPFTCVVDERLPAPLAWEYQCLVLSADAVPLQLVVSSELYPGDVERLREDLKFVLGVEVELWFAPAEEVREELLLLYGPDPHDAAEAFMGLMA